MQRLTKSLHILFLFFYLFFMDKRLLGDFVLERNQ